MKNHPKIQIVLITILALLLIVGASPVYASPNPPKNKVPAPLKLSTLLLTSRLMGQGLTVMRGYFKLFTMDDCEYTIADMGQCYGNNPVSTYVALAIPPWRDEFVDPATKNVLGLTQEGYNSTYRLDPHEAIVILAKMPPPARYFTEQSWIFTRQGTYDTSSSTYQFLNSIHSPLLRFFFGIVPGNPSRFQQFAALSNPVNNVVIERQSGASFGQYRYFIITPDKNMEKSLRKAFGSIGIQNKDVFTEAIPSDMRLGLDETADDFTTMLRYTMPADGGGPGTASEAWKTDLPMVVLRVRDLRSHRPAQPYPPLVLETRTAVDERGLRPDQLDLEVAIAEKWGQPCANADCSDKAQVAFDTQSPPINMVGPLCLKIGMDCLGDNQDASYIGMGIFPLDSGQVYAVVGTLGTRTGNAVYVGLSVNSSRFLKGLANIKDTQLQDTADEYAGSVNNLDKLYTYYFTRDCSGLESLTGGNCFS
ncbi:MAG: hypothetical protein ABSF99_13370, partial [Anaerolineales bacterium]